ncbi:Uma2 family endonuclease [Polyangium mundeleinium]|uniref:Uma2 family endonuclease n=1 Tax=Polyangium mundeleinium TaxID=2995306 RepID=A0ABT5EHI2_9BACT|nr:Uma2 family endonuclease [Polyangium mundeleinium]MDC0741290.1 Uma2 family endonuclease [Polyangium mundeleinium]
MSGPLVAASSDPLDPFPAEVPPWYSSDMGNAARNLGTDDPTFYPTHDDMGESALQTLIIELFRPLLARFLASQGIRAFVGSDQFIYWVQYAPTVTVAPDLYVLPGVDPESAPKCWKVWETGIVPSFALEVMAEENQKDQEQSPRRYDELGVKELVVFDPHADEFPDRIRFSVYRRNARGKLVQVEVTDADRVRSTVLGCFVRVVGTGAAQRLRVGLGPSGDELLPTEAELAEQERTRAEQERTRAEQERLRADAAEAENARLRVELERLRRGGA